MHRSDGGGGRWAAAAGLAVVVVALAAGAALIRPPASAWSGAVAGAATAPASPVVASPLRGPPRAVTGSAYAAYLAESSRLGSLPNGAVWPVGVPTRLGVGALPGDARDDASAVTAARSTWLCAWEWETLAARADADPSRLAQANDRLAAFLRSAWAHDDPSSRWWTDAVIGPAVRGDYGGMAYDLPLSCASAGIPVAEPPR